MGKKGKKGQIYFFQAAAQFVGLSSGPLGIKEDSSENEH